MAEKNISLRVKLDLVDRVLAPLKRINQGSTDTAATLKAARDQLKQLQTSQGDLGSFQRLQTTLGETDTKLKAARDRLRQLANEFAEADNPSKKLSASMIAANKTADQLGAKFNAQQQNLTSLRDKLGAAGISTAQLSTAEQQLNERVAFATANIAKQTQALKLQGDMQRKVASLKRAKDANVAERGNARVALFDGVALAATLGTPLKMAVDFESSMADVAKVMDFGDDQNGLAKMSQSAIDLSKKLPMAAKEIAQIMALGGQSGLSVSELLGSDGMVSFTEHAVKMGTAFGMSAEEAGSSMAKMKSAFGMTITDVATLTDKINLLGNTGAANEKQILSIVTRVGPLGGVAGVAAGEIAALGSTLAGMGVQEEVAATGIQNFMLALTSGASASKKQREMLKGLGLESTRVAKTMQTDATGTMLKVLESVRRLPKHEQAAALAELFGKESIKAIAPMLTQLDTLKENFTKVGDATRYAGAVNSEYATRAATTANQLQLTKNQVAAISITLGNVMLPALNDVLKATMPWMTQLAGLAQAYPGVTKAMVMGVAALMLFKIAAIAGAYAFTFLKGAWLSGQAVLLTLRAAWLLHTGAIVAGSAATRTAVVVSKAMAAAQWLLNASVMGFPLMWIIAAIAAVAAAGYGLYRNWGSIVSGGKALWQGFSTWFMGLMSRLGNWIAGMWNTAASMVSTAVSSFVSGVRSVLDGGVGAWIAALLNFTPFGVLWNAFTSALAALGIQVPEQFRNFGSFIVDGLIGGITSRLGALKDSIVGAASSAATWFKEKLGIASPSKLFTQFGGWISEGAANGITAGQAGVRAAALAMAGAAAAPVGAVGVDSGAAPIAAAPSLAPRISAPAPAAGGNYIFQIHAGPGMDAQAIARAVRAEIENIERKKNSRVGSGLYDKD